jgi:hypothetical protein
MQRWIGNALVLGHRFGQVGAPSWGYVENPKR